MNGVRCRLATASKLKTISRLFTNQNGKYNFFYNNIYIIKVAWQDYDFWDTKNDNSVTDISNNPRKYSIFHKASFSMIPIFFLETKI